MTFLIYNCNNHKFKLDDLDKNKISNDNDVNHNVISLPKPRHKYTQRYDEVENILQNIINNMVTHE